MAGTELFIKDYGCKTFDEVPFCEADNVALCQVYYLPIEKVISPSFDVEPISFTDMYRRYYGYNGNKHVSVGLMLTKALSKKLMVMAETPRYSQLRVVAAREVFCEEPATQFAACTMLLPDGTPVVFFRGTDDTLFGWKEDFDLYITNGIPSQRLSVDYLEEVAQHYPDKKIIVCGHSKGGNLALYAAIKCSKSTRDKIECVYNNEGPGFVDASLFRTEEYKELLDRYNHFLPSAAFVGTLLTHDYDYKVVESKRILGPLQHDLGTWKIEGTQLVTRDSLNRLGQICDLGFMDMIAMFNHEQGDNVGAATYTIIKGIGQKGLLGVAKNIVPSVTGGIKAYKGLPKEQKTDLTNFILSVPKCLFGAAVQLGKGAATAAERRVSEFVDAVAAN